MDPPSATTTSATPPVGSNAGFHPGMPTITTTSADLAASIPSFAAARRARADTLPSRPSVFLQDPTSSPQGGLAGTTAAYSLGGKNPPGSQRPLRRTPSLLVPPQLSTRHRSGSLTLPSASISAAFGPSIFTSSWGDPDSPSGDRPATTPTTREMLFDSENENSIMSTLDALGLDDPVQSGAGSTSSNINMGINGNNHSNNNINNSSAGNGALPPGIHTNHRVGVDLRSRSASFASSALSHLELGSSRGSPTPSTSSGLGMGGLSSRSNSINSLSSIGGLSTVNSLNLNGINGINGMNGMSGMKSAGSGGSPNNGSPNGHASSGSISGLSMPDIRLEKSLAHSLLKPGGVSFANRIRSYSVSTPPAYQEVLEDEHEDEIGQLTSSSPSSGSSNIYNSSTAGGVHQFQTFQQTHSRPRAISMGFLEIPHDIADEQRKFAMAGPRSYSDMKARQTHQRTTSAGADMLSDIVNGLGGSPDKATVSNGLTNGATSSTSTANNNQNSNGTISGGSNGVPGHSHSHSLSHSYSSQLHAQQLQQQHHTQPQRPGHQHSNSFSGRGLTDENSFSHILSNGLDIQVQNTACASIVTSLCVSSIVAVQMRGIVDREKKAAVNGCELLLGWG
ncbi:MAG: hypothetical protein J3R72DRAFT_120148 [Linnemannia gamsii]|nr:MAG: hypothetical protein J3R72DRAFT_120148 [Linnemannia gamsii]